MERTESYCVDDRGPGEAPAALALEGHAGVGCVGGLVADDVGLIQNDPARSPGFSIV